MLSHLGTHSDPGSSPPSVWARLGSWVLESRAALSPGKTNLDKLRSMERKDPEIGKLIASLGENEFVVTASARDFSLDRPIPSRPRFAPIGSGKISWDGERGLTVETSIGAGELLQEIGVLILTNRGFAVFRAGKFQAVEQTIATCPPLNPHIAGVRSFQPLNYELACGGFLALRAKDLIEAVPDEIKEQAKITKRKFCFGGTDQVKIAELLRTMAAKNE